MNRRRFCVCTLGLPLLLPALVRATDKGFADYVIQQEQGFADYQQQLENAFRQYLQLVESEFASYQHEVFQKWGDRQIGSARQLVRYAPDLASREIIDYEKGVITLELIEHKDSPQVQTRLRNQLLEVATATEVQMQKKDVIGQQIEQQMPEQFYAPARVSNDYVVADLLTGEQNPDNQQISQAVLKAAGQATTATRPLADGMQVYSLSIPLAAAKTSTRADKYAGLANKYGRKEKIEPALIMAIMHSESHFNPQARSHIPAYGLMQIVPQSAGRDASAKVYGQQRLLSASYLYNSENNIKIGTAYLGILYYRYLKNIKNHESRLYCTIAAYNTGSGNVARAFGYGTNIARAAQSINQQTPQQVYNRLVNNLPYAETRKYLPLVVSRYQSYQKSMT